MKKLVLSMLMVSALTFAQEKESYASLFVLTDIHNAVEGSKPTNYKPALDLTAGISMVSNNFELRVSDELFNQIGFNKFAVNFGYHSQRYIPLGNKDFNFCIVPSAGVGMIQRWGLGDRVVKTPEDTRYIYGKSSHISVQVGLSFVTRLSDKIMLDLSSDLSMRPDLLYHYPTDNPKGWVLSNHLGVHYIIN